MPKKAKTSHANDIGEVTGCDCGGVNLTIGPMTLHLAVDEITPLYELMTVALNLAGEKPAKRRRPRRAKSGERDTFH